MRSGFRGNARLMAGVRRHVRPAFLKAPTRFLLDVQQRHWLPATHHQLEGPQFAYNRGGALLRLCQKFLDFIGAP
jgi:hypothetical protein